MGMPGAVAATRIADRDHAAAAISGPARDPLAAPAVAEGRRLTEELVAHAHAPGELMHDAAPPTTAIPAKAGKWSASRS